MLLRRAHRHTAGAGTDHSQSDSRAHRDRDIYAGSKRHTRDTYRDLDSQPNPH